jgi:hypothetical protein
VAFGVDARVEGAEQLVALARAVKATGDGQLRKDMLAGLRKAAKPIADAVKNDYRDGLPKTGGLNEFVASARIAPRTRTSGKNAGLRIVATKSGHDMQAIESGLIRHPTYGHQPYVSQSVEAGLGEKGVQKAAPEATRDIEASMQDTLSRIRRSV